MDTANGHDAARPLCPSARPEMDGAVIFGLVGGTAKEPRLAHLVQPLPVTDELLALAAPASPLAVFRTAAPCAESACAHFAQNRCRLVSRIVGELPAAVEGLPACRIRPDCRWWQQEGKAACLRCPLVVTEMVNPSDQLRHATDPAVYSDEHAAGEGPARGRDAHPGGAHTGAVPGRACRHPRGHSGADDQGAAGRTDAG